MEKVNLGNGMVKLASPKGIKDVRNGQVFREVIVKENDVRHFAEA